MINKHAIDRTYKLSKICAIGSLAVLIPFLAYGIWSDVTRHPEPISRIFYDVEFRVFGSAKSPPTIVLSSNGSKVFFADCNSLKELVCDDEDYWKKWHSAKQIEAVEIGANRGIIKSISADASKSISIDSADINAWITESNRTPWQGICGLSIVLFLSITLLAISRLLQSKYSEGE